MSVAETSVEKKGLLAPVMDIAQAHCAILCGLVVVLLIVVVVLAYKQSKEPFGSASDALRMQSFGDSLLGGKEGYMREGAAAGPAAPMSAANAAFLSDPANACAGINSGKDIPNDPWAWQLSALQADVASGANSSEGFALGNSDARLIAISQGH